MFSVATVSKLQTAPLQQQLLLHEVKHRNQEQGICSAAYAGQEAIKIVLALFMSAGLDPTRDRCASAMCCAQNSAGWRKGIQLSLTSTNLLLSGSASADTNRLRNACTSVISPQLVNILHSTDAWCQSYLKAQSAFFVYTSYHWCRYRTRQCYCMCYITGL